MTTEPTIVTPRARLGAAPAAAGADRNESFAVFYDEYYRRVARYCYRLVHDQELARDLAQEALARLYIRWIGVRDPGAYVFHIATNLIRDAVRRAAREAKAMQGSAPAAEPDHQHDVDVAIAVGSLPRRYREVVLLYYFADLPIAEVAAAVRRPEGTVKRHLAEARELLATTLERQS
ncbi:MAG TPA: RNA polymerase sigma factor [Frankiaceae bacterium]|nr:RNA polymerase sigma factor [Frankiaceae bacterium]